MDNEQIKFMSAVIASGVVQSHGTNPEKIAEVSVAIAKHIVAQVDAVPPDEPQQAPQEAPPVE
jgi:hypothetical protein